jgi:toxin-antitoxin system PIN domain toxin
MTVWLCDTNVWLALAVPEHFHHGACAAWFDELPSSDELRFCRSTQQSFLRLLTNPAAVAAPDRPALTNASAWKLFDELLRTDRRIRVQVQEPAALERWWVQYSTRDTASTKLWADAYLAAFAKAGSHRMVTTDRAFHQFEGLDLLVLGD